MPLVPGRFTALLSNEVWYPDIRSSAPPKRPSPFIVVRSSKRKPEPVAVKNKRRG